MFCLVFNKVHIDLLIGKTFLLDFDIMTEVLEPGTVIKPCMTKERAIDWAWKIYGLKATNVKEFTSYDDRNFFFKVNPDSDIENDNLKKTDICQDGYVLKVTNTLDSKNPDILEAQNSMILHMAKADLAVPVPVQNKNGKLMSLEDIPLDAQGNEWASNNAENPPKINKHLVRLLKFIPGDIFYDVDPWLPKHFYQAGVFVAKMDLALKNFHHQAYETRKCIWFLDSIPDVKNFLGSLKDPAQRQMCSDIFDAFTSEVLDKHMDKLETSIIHGDYNEQNILVRPSAQDPKDYELFSVIDFGDSHKNPIIFELGIAIMYMMTKCSVIDPNEAGGHVLAGYETVRKLPPLEKDILRVVIAARYAQSLTMGAYTYQQDPSNDYVLITAKTGWKTLTNFWNEPKESLYKKWDEIKASYE